MRIALVQEHPCATDDQALAVARQRCREAAQGGADVVLFPEMWNVGYRLATGPDDDAWKARALGPGSSYVEAFSSLARELDLVIAFTFLEESRQGTAGAPWNTVAIVDRRGEVVHTYAKTHTCAFGDERWCQPGDAFPVTTVDTREGPVALATMICFDREMPEVARLLMLGGAEVILVPNACDLEAHRLGQVACRAFENMVAVAVANYASGPGNGHSAAYSGMAFETRGGQSFSVDHQLVEGDGAARLVWADLDLAALRAYRAAEVWGAAYRRPGLYGGLVERR